jgi:hypothetical protein
LTTTQQSGRASTRARAVPSTVASDERKEQEKRTNQQPHRQRVDRKGTNQATMASRLIGPFFFCTEHEHFCIGIAILFWLSTDFDFG